LFVIDGNKEQYQIFRRYLFDWRTGLTRATGAAIERFGTSGQGLRKNPPKQQVEADLREVARFSSRLGLPFSGDYNQHAAP